MTDLSAGTPSTEHVVSSLDELVAIVGEPRPRVRDKVRSHLLDVDREWLGAAPFCVLATSDEEGRVDASPKGDPPGRLVHVLDDRTIALAERPGNKRVDGYRNVLANPQVGLVFIAPGRGDTLRVNGRARLVADAPWFEEMVVKGKRPILALVVDVEEVFFHCPKASLRSRLWEPESWDPDALPSRPRVVRTVDPDAAGSAGAPVAPPVLY